MPDRIFENPRLTAIYDMLEGDRSDLDVYVAAAEESNARRVLDVGCGTGTLALRLAARGIAVTALDPAAGSLAVARRKPGAEQVRWVQGYAGDLPALQVDLVTMTGNVAQAIVDDEDWSLTLTRIGDVLRPDGCLVFETRIPARTAWTEWNKRDSCAVRDIPGVGRVESWLETTEVDGPLVSFRWTYVFAGDGEVLTSDSTLRFREREEVESALVDHGFTVGEVRDAPDRPGREMIFYAHSAADR
ncbi:class I SAM-dependent methyltransferase [Rhodococcus sp. 14-2496-1d]|uniref:class I SAM-dependent methyltransferase n=1 Tax=Nocardiaceae TaxID=85025 RepID=UPI00050BE433|nr:MULTISPECIES: class I SAM-dependent methyltransferase [Rhodococcus]OZD83925.1 class I SAM-dependent methyltransferase [Rhodococcus sp. 05-339-2]OZF31542.1 class I SAM-dependent methyltransferase [Rhodococcus sp. 14-2496-1d]